MTAIIDSPTFFAGDIEAAAIERAGHNPPSRLADRWDICGLREVKHQLYYLILGLTSYVLAAVCLSNLSKRLWVISRHELHKSTEIKTQRVFKDVMLSPSVNANRTDTSDVYLQRPCRYKLNTGETVKLQFFHRDGLCRGMSFWFIFLLLKTAPLFTDEDQHFRSVGAQFEKGAPKQAALLHALTGHCRVYDLLHLQAQEDYKKIDPQNKSNQQIIQEIQSLEPGLYSIFTSDHQMVYRKTATHHYLFDPTQGSFKVDSPAIFEKLMRKWLDDQNNYQEISIDKYTLAV